VTIERMLVQYVPGDQRDDLRGVLLTRALSLAVPCLGPRVTVGLTGGDPLLRMQQQLAAGDTTAVRATLGALRETRRGMRPGDVSLDHTFQEAMVLLMLRDSSAATAYLDLPLTALPTISTHLLDDVASAFALGRALALRADLALATGDLVKARRYATEAAELWKNPSPLLQSTVQRLRNMSR
jgi:hypothetical protein